MTPIANPSLKRTATGEPVTGAGFKRCHAHSR
jgi:hypothetical protein